MKEFKGYLKGVNFGGWLSQCDHSKERYENFIIKEDFKNAKSWGLDHVRIPVDYELVESREGEKKPDNFIYLDNAVKWCREYGLNMILDLHRTAGYSFHGGDGEKGFFEDEAYQERFYKLWEEFALRYGKNEDMLAFELLNEVTDKAYLDKWNEIAFKCIERIRKIAPTIKILVGGYWNNSVEAVKDILPPTDENIVYNFHCYEPFIFTHQSAGWCEGMPRDFKTGFEHTYEEYDSLMKSVLKDNNEKFIKYSKGNIKEKLDYRFFENLFEEAIKVAEERDVALYCGEYGVIVNAEPEDILLWYKEINKAFENHKIGRASWTYKSMAFGLCDEHYKDIKDEVIKYL